MQLLPGFAPLTAIGKRPKLGVEAAFDSAFDSSSPGVKKVAPPPTRQDPEISAARERQRKAELKRKGRRSTILTSARGVKEKLGVTRPQARGATLLGE